jgi:ubiquinone/menaquinone biosynthesis C-methylase UbiE
MDDKQWKIFFEIHSNIPRQGPGDNESTKKAYALLHDLPQKPRILDVGCGPGMQTLELAKLSEGNIDALDNYPPYLAELKRKAAEEGLGEKINPVNGNMFALNYKNGTFNLIWSEGAIYIIGFERGLREWKRLLTKKGYIVATEVSWLKTNPPEEARKYWETNYPAIKTISANLEIARNIGYRIVSHFALPEKSWWNNYYTPIEAKLPSLKQKYRDDKDALSVLACEELEMDMFRKHSDHYGYVFYVLQA